MTEAVEDHKVNRQSMQEARAFACSLPNLRRNLILFLGTWIGISPSTHTQSVIRVNQLGYLPREVKIAVMMSKDSAFSPGEWEIRDALTSEVVWHSHDVVRSVPYGGFVTLLNLDFSKFTIPGVYFLAVGSIRSVTFSIGDDVYDGTADFLLKYMRQQRCGYNPFLNDSCHTHDGYVIYHPSLDSTFIDVVGGWHDASDYLQYVTTSATAVFDMLFAYEQHPACFGDAFKADGRPGPNGIPDILDEAKWGLNWLVKMNPAYGEMFNQIADDRDHAGFRLPSQDTVDYGRGRERPVYFCTGKPQGLMKYKNRSTGIASTAGKFSSSFALGSRVLERYYPVFCAMLRTKAVQAYKWGALNPGVCQTAPCLAPYFYEEENWVDDMELAATQLYRLTGDSVYLRDAIQYGKAEPVVPWMGTDGARHYQWYPFVNLGHYFLGVIERTRQASGATGWLKEGIERIEHRGEQRPFHFGIPFIWCSNNYVSATLTQLRLYAEVSHDSSYAGLEASLRDWLLGVNPWGTSMIVGLPEEGVAPKDPHSAFTHLYGYPIDGGLVDGPVRAAIFNNLKGVRLSKPDAFKDFQSDSSVYHDDWADYSTNEPTMDGTASLTYYLSSLQAKGMQGRHERHITQDQGAVIRMDSAEKVIYLVFSGHEFADGGTVIRNTLRKHEIRASFFFTGDFYRTKRNRLLIRGLEKDGHYLGPHSDKHLLYASWANRESLLVSKEQFAEDLRNNYKAMEDLGIRKVNANIFLPPFEWYNGQIAHWCKEYGIRLVNFTPGTRSQADYTVPGVDKHYIGSDAIVKSILDFASSRSDGLNGFILLMHIGADPRRTDKLYHRLDSLITALKRRGYDFRSLR
jgi:endoglucanase